MKKINVLVRSRGENDTIVYTKVEGYKVEVNFNGKDYGIAVHKNSNGKWSLTCLSTGLKMSDYYDTRQQAIDSITIEYMLKVEQCLAKNEMKTATKKLADYKKKHADTLK